MKIEKIRELKNKEVIKAVGQEGCRDGLFSLFNA